MNEKTIAKQSLSVQDIAERMDVDPRVVRVWVNSGKLPAYKLPGSGSQSIIRVKPEVFEGFLRAYEAKRVVAPEKAKEREFKK